MWGAVPDKQIDNMILAIQRRTASREIIEVTSLTLPNRRNKNLESIQLINYALLFV